MEQTIEDLKLWFDLTFEQLVEEWDSKEFKELSDCPSFRECNVYREAINYLIEANYMPEDLEELKMDLLETMLTR